MGAYVSWSRLLAASGLVAITYAYRDPLADLERVRRHLRENAAALGIDPTRIALWAASGNAPAALAALMNEGAACAVLCYGFMLDDEAGHVAAAAAQFGFVTAGAGRSVADLPAEMPLLLVRAGQDQFPYLNASIDRFAAAALARNLPLTLVNHADGPHAFDLFQDTDGSRAVIRAVVAFLRARLV
jgi:acetyl esterase/lipase